jgi:hypothetical protein
MVNRITTVGALLCLLSICGCPDRTASHQPAAGAASAGPPDSSVEVFFPRPRPPTHVHSLIEILAHPRELDGADAAIGGFLVIGESQGGIGGALYLNREDWSFGLMNNVPLRFGPCRRGSTSEPLLTMDDARATNSTAGYAVVRGTFEADGSLAGGSICAIKSITPLAERADTATGRPKSRASTP